MNALLVVLLLASMDGGQDAGVAQQSSSAAAVQSTSALVVDVKPFVLPDLPAPTDAEVPGLVDTLTKAVKDNNYLAGAVAFAMLVLWAIKKFRPKTSAAPAAPTAQPAPTEKK